MQRRRRETNEDRAGEAGFTLVEILVASLVLGIGILATMAMQFTALNGIADSRDLTNASVVADRLTSLMRVESSQWRTDGDISAVQSVYNGGYFENQPLIRAVVNSNWTWQPAFSEPVDVRLSDGGARRFCAYVRGTQIQDGSMASGTAATGILKVQIAVVYPSKNKTFPNASESAPFGTCTGTVGDGDGGNITELLTPPARTSGEPPPIEMEGYRVVYSGTNVTQRSYLQEAGI